MAVYYCLFLFLQFPTFCKISRICVFSKFIFSSFLNVWLWERAFNSMGEIRRNWKRGGKWEISTQICNSYSYHESLWWIEHSMISAFNSLVCTLLEYMWKSRLGDIVLVVWKPRPRFEAWKLAKFWMLLHGEHYSTVNAAPIHHTTTHEFLNVAP